MSRWLLLTFALSIVPSVCQAGTAAPGASFDCRNAATSVEHLICSSDELSSLDGQLGRAVSAWLQAAGPQHASRLAAQRNWLRSRLAHCHIPPAASLTAAAAQEATACLKHMYQERLALLASTPGVQANLDRSGEAHRACTGLAQAIRTAPAGAQSILENLTKTGTGFVRLDLSDDKIGSGEQADGALRERLRWSAHADVPDFSDWIVRIKRLGGGSSVIAAETIEGTAHCQRFWFYELSGGGPARIVSPPEENDGTRYCWGDSRGTYASMGAVGGVPTFAVEEFGDGDESIRLIARRGGEWHPYCALAVSWAQTFAVSDAFCERDDGCAALRAIAPDLVESYDAAGDVEKYWAAVPALPVPEGHKARFAAYIREKAEADRMHGSPADPEWVRETVDAALAGATYRTIEIGGQPSTFVSVSDGGGLSNWTGIWTDTDGAGPRAVDLSPTDLDAPTSVIAKVPTFGDRPDTSYVYFGHDSTIVPIRLGGRVLLARLGKGHFGWRDSNDYLIGAYMVEGGALKPVAGAIVTQTRAPGPTVTEQ